MKINIELDLNKVFDRVLLDKINKETMNLHQMFTFTDNKMIPKELDIEKGLLTDNNKSGISPGDPISF